MSERADVIVVGGGGAGLAAAAEAARLGRSVILLEKSETPGGSTALSAGLVMAAGSSLQRKAGIDDSSARHDAEIVADLEGAAESRDAGLRRRLVENAGATVDAMAAIGIDFVGPLPQAPFATARLHAVVGGGRACVANLLSHCRRGGVDIRAGMKAEFLVKDGKRIAGVEVRDKAGKFHMFLADRAVILATGDFAANRTMVREAGGGSLDAIDAINPAATGDGHRMAMTVGARLAAVSRAGTMAAIRFALPVRQSRWAARKPTRPFTWILKQALRFLPNQPLRPIVLKAAMTSLVPEPGFLAGGAILVDRAGERLPEAAASDMAVALSGRPGAEGFLIFDETVAGAFGAWPNVIAMAPGIGHAYFDDLRRARPDLYTTAENLAGLAQRLQLPADRLADAVAAGSPDRPRPESPPFHALGPLAACLPAIAIGLAVDDRLRVLDRDNRPISGLYAAGLVGPGGLIGSCRGHELAWTLTSGRLAGREAGSDQSEAGQDQHRGPRRQG